MRANQHNLLAGGIVAGAMFAVACSSAVHQAPGPQQPDVDLLLEALDNEEAPDPALVTRILSTAPTHPGPFPARSHVQCHRVRNIRTRATIPLGPSDEDGPVGEVCAVDGGRRRDNAGGINRQWIATVQIDASVVAGLNSVPHLGMAQGLNVVLAVRRTANKFEAVVFPPSPGVPHLVPLEIERYQTGKNYSNGIDIAVWRGNAATACVSCFKYGWCQLGE